MIKDLRIAVCCMLISLIACNFALAEVSNKPTESASPNTNNTLTVSYFADPNPVHGGQSLSQTVHVERGGGPIDSATIWAWATDGSDVGHIIGHTNANGDLAWTAPADYVASQVQYTTTYQAGTPRGDAWGTCTGTLTILLQTFEVSVLADPNPVLSSQSSQVKVHVTDSEGKPVKYATILMAASDGRFNQTGGFTDASGDFMLTFTAPSVTAQTQCTITAVVYQYGYAQDTVNGTITVQPKDINFDINPAKIRATDNVEFNASKYLGVVNGNIKWEFGDGTTDETGNSIVTHRYSEPGFYIVNLTVDSTEAERISKAINVTIPVVLVHGVCSNSGIWQPMITELEKNGYDEKEIWNFDYRANNMGDPRFIAFDLATFINKNRYDQSYNGQRYYGKIDIICHSMGAIVSRWYMEKNDGGIHGKDVRQWIGIAPAHGGSATANYISNGIDMSLMAVFNPIFGTVIGETAQWVISPALGQLHVDSDSVTSLGSAVSPTKYWVIDGWNPTHDPNFGVGPSATVERGKDERYYWVYSGDGLVTIDRSYRKGMEFEAFPASSADLGSSPAYEFDHTHIHDSPRVISYVVDCLKDINKHSSGNKPPEDKVSFLSFATKTISGLLGSEGSHIDISTSDLKMIPIGSNNGPAPMAMSATSNADPIKRASSGSSDDALTFMLVWVDGDVGMSLVSPSGIHYSADSRQNNAQYVKEGNSIRFIITGPESGVWKVSLTPVTYPGHDINYTLTCIKRDSGGNEQNIIPAVNFTANVTQGYAPLDALFIDKSQNKTSIEWLINGTSFGSAASLEHVFTVTGIYNVTLVASNANGTNSTEKDINVTERPIISVKTRPIAKIGANVTEGIAPLTVQFDDQSLNETMGRTWYFEDGNTSTLKNPINTFYLAMNYTVTLAASNENGTNVAIRYINVSAPQSGVLKVNDFTADVTSGSSPLKVNFTSSVSGTPTIWTWNIGRAVVNTIVGTLPVTIMDVGVDDVTLTVKDKSGNTAFLTKKAYITVLASSKKPKANFRATNNKGYAPLTVRFNDTSKNNPTTWSWDFGDKIGKSIDQNPTYTYAVPGKYTVALTVTNAGGTDKIVVKNCVNVQQKKK
jgi:PKD repeat protein